jgi:hypothetical protein
VALDAAAVLTGVDALLFTGRVLFPPASCRRRIMERARPDWLTSPEDRAGTETAALGTDCGGRLVADGVGEDACVDDGTAALRSPVRTRSVAAGRADFPAERARRRAREALRPLDEIDGTADMVRTSSRYPFF